MINWWGLLVFVGVMAVVTAIAMRGRGRRPAASGVPVARITRVTALIYSLIVAVQAVIAVLQTLTGARVSVLMPVQEFWPTLPSTVKLFGASAHVVSGGFSSARVDVAGLDSGARVWLAAGELVQGVTTVLVAVVVVILCDSIIRQDPFRVILTRGVTFAAFGIIVGGIIWQICGVVGGGMASKQVLGVDGWSLDTSKVHWDDVHDLIGLPAASQDWNINFWPLGIGLSLLAVSAVFRYGQRLQRDTAGLI